MKSILNLLLAVCISNLIIAQNLVPNPSFEEYTVCPDNISQFNKVSNWSIFYVTPDYFNKCDNDYVSVPNNSQGNQCAKTGNGYLGMLTYIYNQMNILRREVVYSELNDSLEIGKKYYISFYTSFADKSICSSNNIGVLFSTSNDTSQYLLNNFAHLYSLNIITDSTNWVNISGTFISDSAYKYIFIGNFFDNANTDTILTYGQFCFSYYYVDDICVSEDSLTCSEKQQSVLDFTPNNNVIMQGNCINYNINTVVDYDSYEWYFDGATPNNSSEINPLNICYADTGLFNVTLIAFNNNGCGDTITKTDYITVQKSNNSEFLNYSDDFVIIPNPFNNKIIVQSKSNHINDIFLSDILGSRHSISIIKKNDRIEIAPNYELKKGIYYLSIITNNKTITTKIINL